MPTRRTYPHTIYMHFDFVSWESVGNSTAIFPQSNCCYCSTWRTPERYRKYFHHSFFDACSSAPFPSHTHQEQMYRKVWTLFFSVGLKAQRKITPSNLMVFNLMFHLLESFFYSSMWVYVYVPRLDAIHDTDDLRSKYPSTQRPAFPFMWEITKLALYPVCKHPVWVQCILRNRLISHSEMQSSLKQSIRIEMWSRRCVNV